eukprot:912020_1
MNAFADRASESDIRHSQSQDESDPNQYQYQHSVVEQSGTSEPRDPNNISRILIINILRSTHNKMPAISSSAEPIFSANASFEGTELCSPPTATIHNQPVATHANCA